MKTYNARDQTEKAHHGRNKKRKKRQMKGNKEWHDTVKQ